MTYLINITQKLPLWGGRAYETSVSVTNRWEGRLAGLVARIRLVRRARRLKEGHREEIAALNYRP
jgi:hypothetical protein